MRQSEFWLKIVGIGLLLFGVAFFFKYSIEQGWINPLVRHLFGIAIGSTLLVLGWRLYDKRRPFARVLLGGAIGTFYITCFSAFQLFQLISHPVAFGCMLAIAGTAYFVALRQDDAIFSLIGTAGALGTPFLLYTGSGNLPGLVAYTCLVLAGATAVYFFKGWRLLLWLSALGGWIVLSVGIDGGELSHLRGADTDRWAMQAGLVFAWLIFWLTPLIRKIICLNNSGRWRAEMLGIGDDSLTAEARVVLDRHIYLLAIGSPLLGLMLSINSWYGINYDIFGWAAFGAAALYWLVARFMPDVSDLKNLRYTHVAIGALLFTIGLCLILDGDTLLFTLAGEAALLHLIARRLDDPKVSVGGHILSSIVALWLLFRLTDMDGDQPSMLNAQALTDMWVLAMMFASAYTVRHREEMRAYLFAGAVGLALLFHRELSDDLLFLVVTIEAAAFYLLSRKLKDRIINGFTYLGFSMLGLWIMSRLLTLPATGTAFINYQAGAELALIITGLVIAQYARSTEEGEGYFLASFAALAGLSWRELDGNQLLLALTAETLVLHWLAWRKSSRLITAGAQTMIFGLGIWLADRLLQGRMAELAVFNFTALCDLMLIGTMVGCCYLLSQSKEKLIYRLAAHVAILAWFYRELLPLDNGQGFISTAWGIYGIGMLIAGLRFNIARLRFVGLITMGLVVAKLFLVDLARLETIWRVLLFMGFGVVFLLLSYFFPKLWRKETQETSRPPRQNP
jgi:hypothetical protein